MLYRAINSFLATDILYSAEYIEVAEYAIFRRQISLHL
jgi:hypothetical protein